MSIFISNWTESSGRNPVVLFENLIRDATPNTATSADRTNVQTDSTYDGNLLDTGVSTASFGYDFGEEKVFNSVAVVGDRLAGLTLRIQDSVNGTDWVNVSNLFTFGEGHTFLVVFNNVTSRYIRIVFGNKPDPEEPQATVRHLRAGKLFEFPGGVGYNYTPVWMAQEKELLVSKTLNGQFVGNRVVSKGSMTSIPMIAEERTFVEGVMQPFMQHYNDGRPFIFAAGPTVFDKDVAYVWRQEGAEMKPTFDQSGNWMSFTMEVEGYVK